jgi:pilus assembly protein CpaF
VLDHRSVPPLVEIERAVQARAKDVALDMGDGDGDLALRSLIADEIARWADDVRRARRPHDLPNPAAVAERAFRNLARYGPLTPLLDDDDVWEIEVNSPDVVFVRRHRGPSGYHHEVFHDDDHVARTLTKLLDDASTSHRKLDPTEGLQDAQLDDGARLHIVHGDVARGGHVMVNIRKFTGVAYTRLDELVDHGTLGPDAARFLAAAVAADLSIVIAGAPGSGKTTLLSCCAAELDPSRRVVIAEEVFEADVPLPNVAAMQTRAARADRPAVDLRRLVSGFLRMAPDVAIVGEVRDREALPLLLTLSSGVSGMTTIHAGSARQALTRLRFVCQLADADLPMSALNTLVSEAVDIVVHCARGPAGPRVDEIVAVEDLVAGAEATQFTVTEVFDRRRPGHALAWTGQVPARVARSLDAAGIDVHDLLAAHGGPGVGR